MVEGARPSRRAIARTPSSAASPREISSRSTKRKLRAARRRARGRKPPARSTYHVTVALSHPNTALIWTAGSPCCQRDHNTSTSCDVSRLYLRAMDPSGECVISHLLHSPVEITPGKTGTRARTRARAHAGAGARNESRSAESNGRTRRWSVRCIDARVRADAPARVADSGGPDSEDRLDARAGYAQPTMSARNAPTDIISPPAKTAS